MLDELTRFVRTAWWLGSMAGALLGLTAGVAWAQQNGPRVSRAGVPGAPVTSKDGSVVVRAPMSKTGYRAPVLVFVDRTRDELARVTRLKLGTAACPLEIVIGGQSDGDARVLTARLSEPGGGVHERIELPDPEAADLGRFRRAICVALLRAWMVEAGGVEGTMQDVPAWLVDGVVRHMGRETRQQDVDRMLLLWSRACLPPAVELFAAQSEATAREPAVGAVLAGWFFEKRTGGSPFEALLRGAAAGQAWRPAVAARLLAGTEDLVAFDATLDLWLSGLGRVVVRPGLTSEGVMRRFRSHLLLYPAFFGTTWAHHRSCLTFGETVLYAESAEVRQCAAEQAERVKVAAVGRDGMLIAVSEAYAAFLNAVARGRAAGELTRQLLEAEGMRKELERRTAQGAVLQRQVGE